jgi:hypothetical protein
MCVLGAHGHQDPHPDRHHNRGCVSKRYGIRLELDAVIAHGVAHSRSASKIQNGSLSCRKSIEVGNLITIPCTYYHELFFEICEIKISSLSYSAPLIL